MKILETHIVKYNGEYIKLHECRPKSKNLSSIASKVYYTEKIIHGSSLISLMHENTAKLLIDGEKL